MGQHFRNGGTDSSKFGTQRKKILAPLADVRFTRGETQKMATTQLLTTRAISRGKKMLYIQSPFCNYHTNSS